MSYSEMIRSYKNKSLRHGQHLVTREPELAGEVTTMVVVDAVVGEVRDAGGSPHPTLIRQELSHQEEAVTTAGAITINIRVPSSEL